MKKKLTALVLLACGLFPSPAAAKTHPFGWDDMFAMARLSDPRPSPDGKSILFTRADYDVVENKRNSDLALLSEGGALRRLTFDPADDSNGRWLPDGSGMLFLSSRGGSSQLWRLPLGAGEAEKLTSLPVDIDGFELSPKGNRVLFWSAVFTDCAGFDCTAKRLKEAAESKVKARTFEHLFIRHWDAWNDGRRNHLFTMSLDDKKPVDLMAEMDQDAPTKPFGGGEEAAWSPDGKWVAFTSKPAAGEAWKTNSNIYIAPADASQKPRPLTSDNEAADAVPVFSPDGRTLAYLAMERPGYESDRRHIVLLDLATGRKRALTKAWDRSVEEMLFSADGKTIYATAIEKGRQKIYAVDAAGGEARPLVEEGVNTDLRLAEGGRLVFLQERLTRPKEIFLFDPETGKPSQLSHVNQERLDQIRFGTPEEIWFQNDGRKIRGWLVKPADFREGSSYPLAFLIHGGPQGSWLDDFHYRWNPQFYAGAGYAVLAVDFRGSTGYGQAFTDSIRGNWGQGPYSDLMAGLKEALKKYPWIDKGRMCALGASFGGAMINWTAGEDHPFQCLVTHDGDFDTTSSYFGTEELWFPEWDMTGTPWEKPEVYERNSPMRRVKRWKTPTLVIQGGKDFRVTETEGFSTFNALQRLNIPSKLLYFPDEGHWVVKPQNSRLWHGTVLDWLDRWTKTNRESPK